MKQRSWQEEGGTGGRCQGDCRIGMMKADRSPWTAEVGLIEFPYFWTGTWRKIGQKGNVLGEVFWMGAVLGRQVLERPEIGLPWRRGWTGKGKDGKERRGKRTSRTRG